MTLIEAQACGLPVVTADKGGSAESIEYGETGYSYASGDMGQLQNLLLKILSDDEKRGEMGRAARARAEQLFSQDTMVDNTLKVIEQVLEQ